MNKHILIVFLLSLSLTSYAQDKPILVSAKWVHDHINDPNVVVLQTSYLRWDYASDHIDNSRFLWPPWLAPDSPDGSFNAPEPAKATELLRSLGVNSNSHIIICHMRNEVSPAARMFLTLEDLGFKGKVSWLDGGLDAWKKEGFETTTKDSHVKKGNATVTSSGLLVDKTYVQNALSSSNKIVVDARIQRFYDGEPVGLPRDGHITGAKNIPFTEMVDQTSNMFKPTDQLLPYFTSVSGKDKELVVYCFIGQTASVVYMAGRLLGYNVKLYDGSLQEWTRVNELPMEVTKKD